MKEREGPEKLGEKNSKKNLGKSSKFLILHNNTEGNSSYQICPEAFIFIKVKEKNFTLNWVIVNY